MARDLSRAIFSVQALLEAPHPGFFCKYSFQEALSPIILQEWIAKEFRRVFRKSAFQRTCAVERSTHGPGGMSVRGNTKFATADIGNSECSGPSASVPSTALRARPSAWVRASRASAAGSVQVQLHSGWAKDPAKFLVGPARLGFLESCGPAVPGSRTNHRELQRSLKTGPGRTKHARQPLPGRQNRAPQTRPGRIRRVPQRHPGCTNRTFPLHFTERS